MRTLTLTLNLTLTPTLTPRTGLHAACRAGHAIREGHGWSTRWRDGRQRRRRRRRGLGSCPAGRWRDLHESCELSVVTGVDKDQNSVRASVQSYDRVHGGKRRDCNGWR